jgi:DNA-binding XRE family transcriptional regulator
MSAATSNPLSHPEPKPGVVVTKAAWRAAVALGLSQKEFGKVIGVSEATASRVATEKVVLDVDKKEGELALLFIRLFRSLDALVGGSEKKARAWFASANSHVSGIPKERVQTVEGLVHVTQYLDAMRGKI